MVWLGTLDKFAKLHSISFPIVCRGEGLFGACSSDFWGSWPGEDYEDYDDGDDFEYTHDEFWSS